MAREITFRFAATGLPEIRQQISNTAALIRKIQQEAARAPTTQPQRFKLGTEFSRLEKHLESSARGYNQLTEAIARNAAAQRTLLDQQSKAVASGSRVPASLRDERGRFTGQTMSSLQAEQAQLSAKLYDQQAASMNTMLGIRQRILATLKEEAATQQLIQNILANTPYGQLQGQVQAAQTGINNAIESRVKALQNAINEGSSVLAGVRNQLRADYPKGSGDQLFQDFERAERAINAVNNALQANQAEIDKLDEGGKSARGAKIREILGLDSPGAKKGAQGEPTKKEIQNQERLNQLYQRRRQLTNDLLRAETQMAQATEGLSRLQEGQFLPGLKVGGIKELVETQVAAAKEIASLQNRGFIDALDEKLPGIKEQFEQVRLAIVAVDKAIEAALGEEFAKELEIARFNVEQLTKSVAHFEKEAAETGDDSNLTKVQTALSAAQLTDAQLQNQRGEWIIDNEDVQARADEAAKQVAALHERLQREAPTEGMPGIPKESELIGQLSGLDKILFETFSGLKRRFITSFQFILSGSIIFGIQKMVREFVNASIEVERTFADIGSVLENTASSVSKFEKSLRLESLRQNVLAIANEFNVLPTEANAAAYQMVARFQSVSAALIATRAHLLATKVSTADQSEVLRALTATADVYAQNLDEGSSAMERQIKHARIYMQVLDGATVLQQRFGVAIEDTIEGSAQLAEVFQQLGFSLAEVQATIGLVSRQTGVTGVVAADRISRSVASIATPEVRSQLLKLAQNSELQLSLEDFISDEGGSRAIRKIEDQMNILSVQTTNRVREIIGGRREAAFVAAYFGTTQERRTAAAEIDAAAGAAEQRFNVLAKTTAERVAAVQAQFDSLAQNLSELGFLTPMKFLLITLENVLAVTNEIVQAVSSLIKALNRVRLPVLGGLGDILITMTSMAFAAQTLGNSMKRIGAAILSFSRDSSFAQFFQKMQGALALQQAIPVSGPAGFGATFLGHRRSIPDPSDGWRQRAGRSFLAEAGPVGVTRRGFRQLQDGFKSLGKSLTTVSAATVALEIQESGLIVARRAGAVTTAQVTAAEKAHGVARLNQLRAGHPAMMAAIASTGKFALALAAVAVAGNVIGRFTSASAFSEETAVQRSMNERANRISGGEDAVISELNTLRRIQNERIADAEAILIQIDDEFFSDDGFVGNMIETVSDHLLRSRFKVFGVGATNQAARTAGLPETNTFAAADTIGEIYKGYLEQRAAQLKALIDEGSLSALDAVDAINLLEGLKKESGSILPGSDEFRDGFQEFIDQAVDEQYTGFLGFLSREGKTRILQQDLAGEPGVRQRALELHEARLADQQDAFEQIFEATEWGQKAIKKLLDAAGYRDLLQGFQSVFTGGQSTREGFYKELNEGIGDIQAAIKVAHTFNQTGEKKDLEDELRNWVDAYISQVKADITNFGSVGNAVIDSQIELDRTIAAYVEQVRLLASGSPIGNERFAEELRRGIGTQRNDVRKQQFEADMSHLSRLASAASHDAVARVDAIRRSRDRILDEFEKITGHRNLSANPKVVYKGAFADELNNLQGQYIDFAHQLRQANLEMRTIQEEMLRASLVLAGDNLAISASRITTLKDAIKEARSEGRHEEAFIYMKELANIERSDLQERIRRMEIRAQANVRLGDELAASRAAVDIARAAMEATRRANVIEEEKIAAEDAYRRAQEDYFQMVLRYSALLKKSNIDLTNPVLVARAEAEAAAERYANAAGAMEKEQAKQDLQTANAADQRAFYDDKLNELRFLYDTDRIGRGAYVDGLRRLQAGVDRSTYQGEQIWRDIERTILGLVDQVEQGFNIPSEIRMPTLFEVRRAVQAEEMGVNYLDNREQEINIFVSSALDLSEAMKIIGQTVDVDSARIAPGGAGITLGVS